MLVVASPGRPVFIGRKALRKMIGCTRCGHWHTDAERALNRDLSCTEVKQYWAMIRNEHRTSHGHPAQVTTDESGTPICFKCKHKLGL